MLRASSSADARGESHARVAPRTTREFPFFLLAGAMLQDFFERNLREPDATLAVLRLCGELVASG